MNIKRKSGEKVCLEDQRSESFLRLEPLCDFPFIKHGFSTRLGGVSDGIFSSLNLALKAPPGCTGEYASSYEDGSELLRVRENFAIVARAIGIDPDYLVHAHQTHTANVRIVTASDRGNGIFRPTAYENVDGLVTNEPNVALVTGHADCIPLFFVDPIKHVIGLSHSGWRGTISDIAGNTLQVMTKEFGTDPADVVAVTGPGICGDCYEVSEDVATQFREKYGEDDNDMNRVLRQVGSGKYLLNLQESNRRNFIKAGVPSESCHVCDVCTKENSDIFFSHRATGGLRGGCCGFLMLTE